MNHIKKYIVVLIAITGLFSCKKFLERPPAGKIEETEALSTEDGVMRFLNGTYNTLAGSTLYGGRVTVIKELMADHLNGVLLTEDFGEIYRRKTSIFGAFKNDFYKEFYNMCYRSNKILFYLNSVSEAKKNSVEGQAKFIRGISLFELVRLYAQPYGSTADNTQNGIPIRLTADLSLLGRSSVKEVYAQIIADLTDAADKLPPQNGEYPSKYAAHAFLAKVYFQMNDFAKAYENANIVLLEAVKPGALFAFDPLVSSRFTVGESTEGIYYVKNRAGNFEPGAALRDNFRSNEKLPVLRFNDQALALFGRANDKRAPWLSTTLQSGNIVLTKYNLNTFDLPIVHVTEIKLIRAESAGELNQNLDVAARDLNDILGRAGLPTINLSSPASVIISTARREREEEMIGEGSRLDEIKRIGVRNGINLDRRGSPFNCNGFILQFPDIEKAGNSSFVNNPEGGCL